MKISGLILFLISGFLIPIRTFSQAKQERPNIIFILTDDQRWDELGVAGNKIIKTPNMDQLASEGVYFRNAFVTTPICAASRASIATGLYERTHQFTFGTPPLRHELVEESYFRKLQEAGYYTGFIGKFGMVFENSSDKELFNYYDAYMPDFYYRLTGEGGTTHTYLTYLTGEKAENFIEHAPDDRPFCLSISFNAPHAEDRSPDQYIYPENLTDLYSDVTIPDPALGDESYFLQQPEFVRTGMNRIRWHWRFDTPEKYQKMVKGYYRMITAVDEVVGRLRDKLATQGKSNNTVIILLGDNGYFLGERGLAGKWLMYDNSLRVPLIIYDPRNDDNRRTDDHITLNIDIAPTVMDLAGVRIPEIIQGKSLVPLLHENPDGWRTEFFCEHLFNNPLIPKSQGIRTAKWKYFRYIEHPGYEELYDLEKDPLEINNLAGNPDYRKKKDELRKLSDEKFIQLGNVTDSSGKN